MNKILMVILIVVIVIALFLLFKSVIKDNEKYDDKYKKAHRHKHKKHTTTPIRLKETVAPTYYCTGEGVCLPEETFITQPAGSRVGIALCGGGIRASCASWGILKALNNTQQNDKSLLHIDNVSYMSANSGSTWILLPLLYQPLEGTNSTLDSILGQYTEPADVDLTKKIDGPTDIPAQFGYYAVNNIFNVQFKYNWWAYSVGNSFFQPYGLYDGIDQTNRIVGLTAEDVNLVISQATITGTPVYKGVYLRPSVPIPIAFQTFVTKDNRFMAMDSTPISTGFFISDTYGGRVSSYAFNTVTNFQENALYFYQDTWDPVLMSGTSSMASGVSLLKFGIPEILPLIGDFSCQTKDILTNFPSKLVQSKDLQLFNDYIITDVGDTDWTLTGAIGNNLGEEFVAISGAIPTPSKPATSGSALEVSKFKVVDGQSMDNTSFISLAARGVDKAVITIYSQIGDILVPISRPSSTTTTSSTSTSNPPSRKPIPVSTSPEPEPYIYLFIVNGDYKNNVGKVTLIDYDHNLVKLDIVNFGCNDGINCFDNPVTVNVQCAVNDVRTFGTIIEIANLFGKGNPDCQVLKNDNNQYETTLHDMITNYYEYGIFYSVGNYMTFKNSLLGIEEYNVRILWYCLSPCPNFNIQLSTDSKNVLANMYNIPNVCTLFPYKNDCNGGNPDCEYNCNTPQGDVLVDPADVQRITDAQAVYISSLTAWVAKQIIVPFVTNQQINTNRYTMYLSQKIIYPPTPSPVDSSEDMLKAAIKTLVVALNNKMSSLPESQYNMNAASIIPSAQNGMFKVTFGVISGLNTLNVDPRFLIKYYDDSIVAACNLSLTAHHSGGNFSASVFGTDVDLGVIPDLTISVTGGLSIKFGVSPLTHEGIVIDLTESNLEAISLVINDIKIGDNNTLVNFLGTVAAASAILVGWLVQDEIRQLYNIITTLFGILVTTYINQFLISERNTIFAAITTQNCDQTDMEQINAPDIIKGISYTIYEPGNTDWTACGATESSKGIAFSASGPCSGSGIAQVCPIKFTLPFSCNKCKYTPNKDKDFCNNGTWDEANSVCVCNQYWTGEKCNTPICIHGKARLDNDPPFCECDDDWYGQDCSEEYCPNNCSEHGICTDNHICICATGWAGGDCSTCDSHFTGPNCDTCAGKWTGTDCHTCPPHWNQDTCEKCANFWVGDDCETCPPQFCGPPDNCDKSRTCDFSKACGGYDGCTQFSTCPLTYFGSDPKTTWHFENTVFIWGTTTLLSTDKSVRITITPLSGLTYVEVSNISIMGVPTNAYQGLNIGDQLQLDVTISKYRRVSDNAIIFEPNNCL